MQKEAVQFKHSSRTMPLAEHDTVPGRRADPLWKARWAVDPAEGCQASVADLFFRGLFMAHLKSHILEVPGNLSCG